VQLGLDRFLIWALIGLGTGELQNYRRMDKHFPRQSISQKNTYFAPRNSQQRTQVHS
jgi:hypothetical protein